MSSDILRYFDDLELILAIGEKVARVNQASAPSLETISHPIAIRQPAGRLAALSGSFNPLTIAHGALILRALESGVVDEVSVVIAVHTIDKVESEGASLSDRLISLVCLARDQAKVSVAVTNRGLYAEQAAAYRRSFPGIGELFFLVGYDKIVQILDPRYYQNREQALGELFRQARLIVAPRGEGDLAALERLLSEPANKPFAGGVSWLPLEESYRRLSSSEIRRHAGLDADHYGVSPYAKPLIEAGAYSTDPAVRRRYELRGQLIEALTATPAGERSKVDFRELMRWLRAGDERIKPVLEAVEGENSTPALLAALTRAGLAG